MIVIEGEMIDEFIRDVTKVHSLSKSLVRHRLNALIVAEKIAFLQEMLDTADESADTYKWSKKSYREYLDYELDQLKGKL